MSDLRHLAHQPCVYLRPFVREILWIESSLPRTQVLLPETALTIMLRQSGAGSLNGNSLASTLISGLQRCTRVAGHTADSTLLVVRFTETGAAALLRDRVDLLYNRTVALDNVLPRATIDSLQDILAETPTPQRKIAALERFLCHAIRPHTKISPQIAAAVQMIRSSHGRASIATVARRAGMSQSALERHFGVAVGASPKSLSRLARLEHVCRLWDSGLTLTEIAHAAGYADQPHLTRDFRAFTGTAPTEFFRNGRTRNLPTFYK